jgi:hypothetical protein
MQAHVALREGDFDATLAAKGVDAEAEVAAHLERVAAVKGQPVIKLENQGAVTEGIEINSRRWIAQDLCVFVEGLAENS